MTPRERFDRAALAHASTEAIADDTTITPSPIPSASPLATVEATRQFLARRPRPTDERVPESEEPR